MPPRDGHLFKNVTLNLILTYDPDLGATRHVSMTCAFVPNMSLVNELV